jgi:hypothetical protein
MIEFRSRAQVQALLEMFAGGDATIAVERFGMERDEAHSGPGLYGYHPGHPEEGSVLLDPPKVVWRPSKDEAKTLGTFGSGDVRSPASVRDDAAEYVESLGAEYMEAFRKKALPTRPEWVANPIAKSPIKGK